MAFLTLEDGTQFEGAAFGASRDVIGEVVFNTSMTGYQSVLTDPSYLGQIVTMTYPLIGNYGVNEREMEAETPKVTALIVRELCEEPNNWESSGTLREYMERNGIPGLMGIDTRALTRKIRSLGTMRGLLTIKQPTEEQLEEIKKYRTVLPVDRVTTKEIYKLGEGSRRVAVMDFGLKRNIIRSLVARGVETTVFPARIGAEEIISGGFDGVMLTNGPGDPKENEEVIGNIKELLEKSNAPIFGICLGHQMLAIAMGADTSKMKWGHRGGNHPVKDVKRDRVFITSQNHGYAIVPESVPDCAEISHINMNDGSIEGIRYKGRPVFSVQFHPEASPGPQDTTYLFDKFIANIDEYKEGK